MALARRFGLRLSALPVIAGLWLWAASARIWPFPSDFGTTWSGTEPLRGLVLHPVDIPLALAAPLRLALVPSRRRRG